jgi:hypothetical protein
MSKKKQQQRLVVFKELVEKWRQAFAINSFDIMVEHGDLTDGTLADVTRDVDARSCLVRLHPPSSHDEDLSALAKHEMIHVLIGDLAALAHSREARHEDIARAEESLVVKLTRLL